MYNKDILDNIRQEILKNDTAYIKVYDNNGLCWVAYVIVKNILDLKFTTENYTDTMLYLSDKVINTISYTKNSIITDEIDIIIKIDK